jgi:O-antigen biosynthesis protein
LFFARSSQKGASLTLRIGPEADRFLFIMVEGRGGPFDGKLHFESASGTAPFPVKLESTNFGGYVIAPALLATVERLRLEVSGCAEKVLVLGLATKSRALLRVILWVASRWRWTSPLVRVRFEFIGEHSAFSNLRTGLRRRRTAKVPSHFRHVVDLAAAEDNSGFSTVKGVQREPLISFVVPVFDTKPKYLHDLLTSFRIQPRELCQLVLSDDGSRSYRTRKWLDDHADAEGVLIIRNSENKGIAGATNVGIERATGHWIALVDHDDALAPFAVSRIARALAEAPRCRFLYTDEVITDRNLRPVDYFLKPAWDIVLLSGVNYINHLSLYRRDRLKEIGGLREGVQGSQDYDLLLRYTSALAASEILHLPYPAYLWRRDGRSFSAQFLQRATKNARSVLAEHYGRVGRSVVVEPALSPNLHRLRFDIGRADWPSVSVVIPSRDALPLISRVLEGLVTSTDYPTLELIVIDNGSKDDEVLALYDRYRQGPIPFQAWIEEAPFNFSRSVNRGVSVATGEYILLLNNDIEILESNWLKEMVSCFDYPGTGIVGSKLLYPDRTIQHVGVIAGLGGLAGHWFVSRDENFPGPMARLSVRQSLSVVTGACMLVSRRCFEQTGHFDEKVFGIAYNDVDFCLRAIKQGFRVVWTPFAKLIHHESASRGSDESILNIERFQRDQQNLRERHCTGDFEDRAFNPWYSKDRSLPAAILLEQLPAPR